MSQTIDVPYNFHARDYQKPLYNAIPNGYNRVISVWHRRAGKDKTFISICGREAFKRVGMYFYILPYYKQARTIAWEGMDKDGFRMLHHIPPALYSKMNNQEMTLELVNGSVIKFLGSDNIDSIVGTNPVGIFFSEYSLHKVNAWNYLRPILLENGGFAMFNGTPRGKNHLYKLLKDVQKDEKWFTEVLTIEDTGVMTREQVEEEIRNGMPRALAMQEFYCSFDAALTGAYYEENMMSMVTEKRITRVPWETGIPVHTAWDLGMNDQLVILFYQQAGREVRVIDMIVDRGKGLEFYVKAMNERPYVYGIHALPHDVEVRELGNEARSRKQTLYSLGLKDIHVVPRASIEDGINAARRIFNRVWIDEGKCDFLIEALKSYRAQYNEETQVYGNPVHDWSSNPADAFRMLAQTVRDNINSNDLPSTAYDNSRIDPMGQFDPRYVEALQVRQYSQSPGSYVPMTQYSNWNPRDHQDPYVHEDSRYRF